MQHRGLVAGLSVAMLALGGCGATVPVAGASSGPGASADSTTQDPPTAAAGGAPSLERLAAPPTGPTFPLTVRRTGGIADFHDTIVIRANGTLKVDTKDVHDRTCTLDKATRNSLLVALSTLQLGAPASPTTPVPEPSDTSSDPIMITVTDVHSRPVDIGDPSLGEIRSRLTALVGDVTLTVPAVTRCTNPTS